MRTLCSPPRVAWHLADTPVIDIQPGNAVLICDSKHLCNYDFLELKSVFAGRWALKRRRSWDDALGSWSVQTAARCSQFGSYWMMACHRAIAH